MLKDLAPRSLPGDGLSREKSLIVVTEGVGSRALPRGRARQGALSTVSGPTSATALFCPVLRGVGRALGFHGPAAEAQLRSDVIFDLAELRLCSQQPRGSVKTG